MHITINKGTTDVIIDIEDLIDLLKHKLTALELVKDKSSIISIQDGIIYLEEYLLSIYKKE